MKLSISNIAWGEQDDQKVYKLMIKHGFEGLEIAPTRIFPMNPYKRIEDAKIWSKKIKREYGFAVSSMQSIWYGRQEKIFGSVEERQILLEYTKKAIDFAEAIGCKNIVFGCPGNRMIPKEANPNIAVPFFREIGDYAVLHNTIVGIEANPPMYNTNYINDTIAALALIERTNSKGFRLNLDVGTMIQNNETVYELKRKVKLINHIHISEPGLKPIKKRELHLNLKRVLANEGYQGFVSIEMKKVADIHILEENMEYVRSLIR